MIGFITGYFVGINKDLPRRIKVWTCDEKMIEDQWEGPIEVYLDPPE